MAQHGNFNESFKLIFLALYFIYDTNIIINSIIPIDLV